MIYCERLGNLLWLGLLGVLASCGCNLAMSNGQDLRPVTAADDSNNNTAQALQSLMKLDAGDGLNQQLKHLVLQQLPATYVDDRKWKLTQEIKTLIPRSEPVNVNHGTWRKYELRPVDPENTLAIRLTEMRNEADGRLRFSLECDVNLEVTARQARWGRGVQLYSIRVDASTQATLKLECSLGLKFDFQGAPAIVLDPHVLSSEITWHELRIHRISKVGGEIAQQATRATEKWLNEHASENHEKIVTAINTQLHKKPEKLRVALGKQ